MYGKQPTPTALSGNWAMCKNPPPSKRQINQYVKQQEMQELEDWLIEMDKAGITLNLQRLVNDCLTNMTLGVVQS